MKIGLDGGESRAGWGVVNVGLSEWVKVGLGRGDSRVE